MAESSYDKIAEIADYLKLSISAEEIAGCFTKLNMNQEEIDKTVEFFEILEEKKKGSSGKHLSEIKQTSTDRAQDLQ